MENETIIGIQFADWKEYINFLAFLNRRSDKIIMNHYPGWMDTPVIIDKDKEICIEAMSLKQSLSKFGEGNIEWLDSQEYYTRYLEYYTDKQLRESHE